MVSVCLLSEQLAKRTHVALSAGVDVVQEKQSWTPPATPVTITLERQPGTPADEVARAIGARLGWPVYDHELLEEVSRELNVPVKQLEDIDERGQSWLLECILAFASENTVSENAYVHRLVNVIRNLAAGGSCVIVGHGAGLVLPSSSNLRVRLVGALDDRITNLSRTLGIGREEAARKIQDTTSRRMRFLRDHFNVDPAQLDHCALVLNTSCWSPATCAELVAEALRHKVPTQVRPTGSTVPLSV